MERLTNLETASNLQGFTEGRNAPAPPKASLSVVAAGTGLAAIQITNPEYLPGSSKNRMRAPIKHWVKVSPYPDFSSQVQDFGVSHQTHWTVPVAKGLLYVKLYSTFDGVTFNNPIIKKVSVS